MADANIGGQGIAAGIRRRDGFEADVTTAWIEDPGSPARANASACAWTIDDGHAVAAATRAYAIDTRMVPGRFATTRDAPPLQDGAVSASSTASHR